MRIMRMLVPLALAGALLAGCGGAEDSGSPDATPGAPAPTDNGVEALEPNAIVQKAIAALTAAKSYSVKGEIKEDQTLGIDFKISGDDLAGTVAVDGAKAELLRIAGQAYIRGDEKFWTAAADAKTGPTIAKLLGDRWAKLSTKDASFNEFFQITDPAQLLKPDGTVIKNGTKTISGVKAVDLADSGTDAGHLYVATTGEPYPVALEGPPGKGQIAFGDFGATFDIKAPAPGDVIDLDKLKGN
jgi:hypothetical protein